MTDNQQNVLDPWLEVVHSTIEGGDGLLQLWCCPTISFTAEWREIRDGQPLKRTWVPTTDSVQCAYCRMHEQDPTYERGERWLPRGFV